MKGGRKSKDGACEMFSHPTGGVRTVFFSNIQKHGNIEEARQVRMFPPLVEVTGTIGGQPFGPEGILPKGDLLELSAKYSWNAGWTHFCSSVYSKRDADAYFPPLRMENAWYTADGTDFAPIPEGEDRWNLCEKEVPGSSHTLAQFRDLAQATVVPEPTPPNDPTAAAPFVDSDRDGSQDIWFGGFLVTDAKGAKFFQIGTRKDLTVVPSFANTAEAFNIDLGHGGITYSSRGMPLSALPPERQVAGGPDLLTGHQAIWGVGPHATLYRPFLGTRGLDNMLPQSIGVTAHDITRDPGLLEPDPPVIAVVAFGGSDELLLSLLQASQLRWSSRADLLKTCNENPGYCVKGIENVQWDKALTPLTAGILRGKSESYVDKVELDIELAYEEMKRCDKHGTYSQMLEARPPINRIRLRFSAVPEADQMECGAGYYHVTGQKAGCNDEKPTSHHEEQTLDWPIFWGLKVEEGQGARIGIDRNSDGINDEWADVIPPAVLLLHEMTHALNARDDAFTYNSLIPSAIAPQNDPKRLPGTTWDNGKEKRVIEGVEADIMTNVECCVMHERDKFGDTATKTVTRIVGPVRTGHRGARWPVRCSTCIR